MAAGPFSCLAQRPSLAPSPSRGVGWLVGPWSCRQRPVVHLLLPLLLEVASAGFDQEPPRLMIASGLLIEQVDEVAEAFADTHGLLERDRRISGEWAALLLAQAS